MAVKLTYHGTPYYDQIMQQNAFKAGKPTGGFSLRAADIFQSGPKTFTSPSLGVAQTYGKTIPVASSTSNLRLPSGGIPGKTLGETLKNITGTRFGTEIVQTPEQATKGMRIAQMAEKLKNVSPTAARLLGGETIRGIGGSSVGRTILGRTLGTLLGGTVASTGGILASPYIAMANQLYGPNVEKAQDFAGMYGEAMPEDMYEEYFSYLGEPGISQALSDTVMAEPRGQSQFQDYPGVENLGGVQNFDLQGVQDIISQMEEEKGNYIERPEDRFSLDGILQSLGGYAKDYAGRYIGSQALGGAGAMLLGPIGGLVGGIAGLLGGGDLFNQNSYSQQMYNNLTPEGKTYASSLYGPGGILQGYNQINAFGRGTLGTIGNILANNPNMSATRKSAFRKAADDYISGIDPTQQGINAVTKPGTYSYDDSIINYAPPSGGDSGGSSGGETYGNVGSYEDFGSTY
jgi:hypothetical protein